MTRAALSPLIPAALVCWGVTLVLIHVERASWLLFGCGLVGCALAVCWRGSSELSGVRAGVFVASAAVVAVSLSIAAQLPAREATVARIGTSATIEAVAVSKMSAPRDGRAWVDVHGTVPGAGTVPLRLLVSSDDEVRFGATIEVFGQLGEPWGPGAAVATVRAHRAPQEISDGGVVMYTASNLRDAFIARSTRLPGSGAELLPGLAVGDTRSLSPEVEEAMLHSGLSHLTAVSGANCAIVTAIAFGAAALSGARRGVRVIVALTALGAFVVLVTPEPSVVRAAVMAAVALLALMLGRARAGGGALALAVVAILIFDPWLAISAGFALSVASTSALLYLMVPIASGLQRVLPKGVAWALAAPLSAQLACGPIIALFADEQSLVSTLANLLAAPAAPIVTVIGMIGCLVLPIPLLADFAVAAAWLPAQWIASTAEISASLPNAIVPLASGPLSSLVVAALSAAVFVLIVRPSRGRVLQSSAVIVVSVACAWALSAVLVRVIVAPLSIPQHWAIAACDVGQGDAFVVRSADAIALIDTGEDPQLLRDCLAHLRVDHVDLLVLTHFDLDHVGGAPALAGRVGNVLHGGVESEADAALLRDLERGGAELHEASAGLSGTLGAAQWRVLWPRRDERVFQGGNAQSVVVQFGGGDVPSLVALGDLGENEQRALLNSQHLPRAEVVKVSHHGSADQYAGLYEALAPRVALIGVGAGNTFGHPRDEILAVLCRIGASTFRTDRDGLTLVWRDENLRVWTDHSGSSPSEVTDTLER